MRGIRKQVPCAQFPDLRARNERPLRRKGREALRPAPALQDISFGLEKGQKTAIVARNGTGKSTLLKCIAGLKTPDGSTITFNKGLRVGYLNQSVHMTATHSLVDEINLHQDDPITNAVRAYEHAVARHADDATMQEAIHEMTEQNAWDHEAHVQVLLHRFGLRDMGTAGEHLERRSAETAGHGEGSN